MAVQTAANLGALGLPAIAPLLRADLALSRQTAGSLLSVYYVGATLTSFPAGWLADRAGVRFTLVAGQGLSALAFLAMVAAPGPAALLLAVAVAGAGFGAVNPTSTKAILVWFPARSRATVIGIKQAGFPLGGALGALTLPALAGWLGWRGALGVAGLAMGLTAALGGLGWREPPGAGHAGLGPPAHPQPGVVLRNRSIWFTALATFLFAAVQVAWIGYLPLFLGETLGLSLVAAGAVLGQAQLAGIVGRVAFGIVSDRLLGGRRLVVLWAAGLASAGLCLATASLAAGAPAPLLSLVALAFGLVGIGWNGVHHTLVAEVAGRESAATAVGLVLAVSSLGVITGPVGFGLALERGGYPSAWLALAVAMGLAVTLLLPVRETGRAWR